jgi:protein gp37
MEHLRRAPAYIRFLSIEPLLEDLGEIDLSGIHWAIVGGESGYGARPMKRGWVLKILQQCREQNVRFFFKQWGGVHKSMTGRLLDGRTYDEFPDAVQNPIASLAAPRLHASRVEA